MSSYLMFYGMLNHIQKLENRINEAKLFLAHCSFMEEAPEMHAILDGEITAADTIAGQVAEETAALAKQFSYATGKSITAEEVGDYYENY